MNAAAKPRSDVSSGAPAEAWARYEALLAGQGLVRGGRIEPVWLGPWLAFIDRAGEAPEIAVLDRATGTTRWRRRIAELVGVEAAEPLLLRAHADGDLLLATGGKLFAVSPEDGACRPLSDAEGAALAQRQPKPTYGGYPTVLSPELEAPSPDGRFLLTLRDHDLWLRPAEEGEARRLTEGGLADPRWSTARAAWSPDGRRVAAMRVDERQVNRVPLVDWTGRAQTVTWAVYPRADGAIPINRVWLIDVASGEAREVGGGDADHYAFLLGFNADGTRLRFARLERRARHVEILEHDTATGRTRTLLEERSETFLCWTPVFILEGPPVRFLSDGRFLWQSERTGWNQVYLYDANGRLERPLTEGAYPVTGTVAVDEAAGWVLYRAQPDPRRPYDVQIHRANLATGARVQLSGGLGVHEALAAPDGAQYVAIRSAPDRPPTASLHAGDGRLIAKLSEADASGLKALGWRPPEPFVAKAADGTSDLHGLIYKPADFDPRRSYPVLEHIYAGGQTIHTPHAFGPGVGSAFAQLGFVVVVLDARGTPGRGKVFQDAVFGRLGDYEIADHAGALREAAASRPWMDLSRVGTFGLSYGGYFTIRALIQAPDLYRAGVALAPAELGPGIMTMPVESYIGLPADDPARYAAIRNTDKLAALTGDLLIVTGTDDVNTPIGQTMAYARALIAAGKVFDQVVIPEVNHLMMDAAGRTDIAFAYAALLRHFQRTLKPEGGRP